ncbi:hypothetical protein TVAG_525360, partial [Trichomonas vaginalis G3]
MLRVKAKITFEDAIKSKADKDELDATNKVLKSHKHNISDINELQATLNSKADKNHTHESFTTVRADDIILNYNLGSSTPLENPSTSVKDTLNSLDSKCMNIEGRVRNFETYELPAMLDKKADKTYVDEELEKKASRDELSSYTRAEDIAIIQKSIDKKADKKHWHYTVKGGKGVRVGSDYSEYLERTNETKVIDGITYTRFNRTKTGVHYGVHREDIRESFEWNEEIWSATAEMDMGLNPEFFIQIVEVKNYEDIMEDKADKTELQTLKTEILQTLYPIGSIYT